MAKRLAVGMVTLGAVALLLALTLTTGSRPSQAQFPPVGTFTPIPTPTLFLTPTPTLTPTPPLTPAPTSAAPGCANPLPLLPGSVITVRSGVNIRSAPSISAPWLANYPEPRDFTVLDGPVCGDNYLWWQVRGHGITGWVAERNAALTFILNVDDDRVNPTCPTPLDLVEGEQIELVTGVRLRDAPSLGGLILTVAPLGTFATVLDETTVCSDGFTWRFVRVEVVGVVYDGWMVEGSSSITGLYFSEQTPDPAAICARPAPLRIGDLGRIFDPGGPPKNLRAFPGEDAPVLFTLVDNVPFEVIGGPVCIGSDQWWQIRVRSTIPAAGWVAQGPAPNYWLRVVVAAPTLTPMPSATPTTAG